MVYSILVIESFRAIYEQGVLRPLEPLDLAESAEVECTLVESGEMAGRGRENADIKITSQKSALHALFDKINQLPQHPVSDGLHGRDHDQILYGADSRRH